MPGLSAPSSLASNARTVTERVFMSTRESMLATEPAKLRPGNAGAVARIDNPSRKRSEEILRHREIELDDAGVIERGDDVARADERADADATQAHASGERRADHGVFEPRGRGAEPRAIGFERGFELIEARLGQSLRVQQLAAAVVLALALGERGLRGGDIGARLGIVELHEHLAALHALAVAKRHRGDDVGNLGADVDGFVGARVAERLEFLADAFRAHRRERDRGRCAAAPATALRRTGRTGARPCAASRR